MPKRGTDPETFEQPLTRLEDMLVDPYTDTRADGWQAAIAPRYSLGRAGQSAYPIHYPLQAVAILVRLIGMDPSRVDEGLNPQPKSLRDPTRLINIREKLNLTQCLKRALEPAIYQIAASPGP